MMAKRYAVLGGGGSFGIHTSKYLLEQPDTERVLGIGRAAPKPEPFTLNVGKGDKRYSYHAYHVTHELDLLMELLDREKPNIVVCYAAQGEGAARGRTGGATSKPTRWDWHGWQKLSLNATTSSGSFRSAPRSSMAR